MHERIRTSLLSVCARLAFMAGPVLLFSVALGGCFLVPSPTRPSSQPVSGPPVYVEDCATCHKAQAAGPYAASVHAAKGIRCGQCHVPGTHPDFTQPVRDGKCGGCHQPQFQQTLASKHFTNRGQLPLDSDRAAREALRREGFVVAEAGGRKFAGDAASGDLGGRLCVACHYDEHRLGLRAVQRTNFCVGCHTDRDDHFPADTADPTNRCISCHVRVGETVTGQVVHTHRFAMPGSDGGGQ